MCIYGPASSDVSYKHVYVCELGEVNVCTCAYITHMYYVHVLRTCTPCMYSARHVLCTCTTYTCTCIDVDADVHIDVAVHIICERQLFIRDTP